MLAGQAREALVLALQRPDRERSIALLRAEGATDRRHNLCKWERAERRRLAERRHLHPVDRHRLARVECDQPAGRNAGHCDPGAQVAEPRHGLGGAHGARKRGGVRVVPLLQPCLGRRGHVQRRLDRATAQLVRKDHPCERRRRLGASERCEIGGPATAEVVEDRVDLRLGEELRVDGRGSGEHRVLKLR